MFEDEGDSCFSKEPEVQVANPNLSPLPLKGTQGTGSCQLVCPFKVIQEADLIQKSVQEAPEEIHAKSSLFPLEVGTTGPSPV